MLRPDQARAILQDPESTPPMLLAGAVGLLSSEAVQWDPATVQAELSDKEIRLPPAKFNQLIAAMDLVATDRFWTELNSYIVLTNALYAGRFDLTTFDPATTQESCCAIADALLIWPHHPATAFAGRIVTYIDMMRVWEGVFIPPKFLVNCFGLEPREDVFHAWSTEPHMIAAIYQTAIETAAELDEEVLARIKRVVDVANKYGAVDIAAMAAGLYAAAANTQPGVFESWLREVM